MKKTWKLNHLLQLAGGILFYASIAGIAASRHRAAKEADVYRELTEYLREEQKTEVITVETEVSVSENDPENGMGQEEEAETVKTIIPETYDWEVLKGINKDVLGWLFLPDSMIDFPVTGTSDDKYYLSHAFTGEENRVGSLFMDSNTQKTDYNRVIYGHNMGPGSEAMFSTLLYFEEEEYFRQNRYFYYTETEEETKAYEIIAVVKYDIRDAGEWDFRTRNHRTAESRDRFLLEIMDRALHCREPRGIPKRLITLSTCDRREHGKNGRFLVIGAAY